MIKIALNRGTVVIVSERPKKIIVWKSYKNYTKTDQFYIIVQLSYNNHTYFLHTLFRLYKNHTFLIH